MSTGMLARIERKNMTLMDLIKLVREKNARVVNILGTPVIEIEENHATRRIVVSNLVFEKDRVKEKTVDGREKIYLVSPSRILRPTAHGGDVVKT
jgi:hypothetical protein